MLVKTCFKVCFLFLYVAQFIALSFFSKVSHSWHTLCVKTRQILAKNDKYIICFILGTYKSIVGKLRVKTKHNRNKENYFFSYFEHSIQISKDCALAIKKITLSNLTGIGRSNYFQLQKIFQTVFLIWYS